jgi:hypothetical protein
LHQGLRVMTIRKRAWAEEEAGLDRPGRYR